MCVRTSQALNITPTEAERYLNISRQQSVRINALRCTNQTDLLEMLKKLGWDGAEFDWSPACFSIKKGDRVIHDSALINEGEAYIQNASSWLPVLALDPNPKDCILDMCAAPGGKASHIAALTKNQAELWVNDNSYPRLAKTKANFKRLNVQPAKYTMYDARYLTKKMPDKLFDKILLDAPCSGEGMITLNSDKDMSTWSVAHIRRLQSLQKQLIMQAWQLLKPGGTLVYSTCTMAPEENEMVIDYLLRKNDDALLQPIDFQLDNRYPPVQEWNNKQLNPLINNCLRLAPSPLLEAFFVAKIVKDQ